MSREVNEHSRQANFFNICETCPHTNCCIEARPPITSKRKTTVVNYLKNNGQAMENAFEEKNSYTFPKEIDGNRCGFLDKETRKCRVHSVKPETCVAGPITFDIDLDSSKIEWFLKTEKICPLAGALYRSKSELQKHTESARRELLALMHDLDANALQAILKIEEPDTVKIGEEDLDADVLAKLKLGRTHAEMTSLKESKKRNSFSPEGLQV